MKYFLFLLIPLILNATEQNLQKLMSERAQLEAVNSQLQSEVRASGGERDRINEKILNIQDEITEIKRKLSEAKEKRTILLAQAAPKNTEAMPALNKSQLEASINEYEHFVKNGIPWDIEIRLDKLHAIKLGLKTSKEPLSESVLQWSQFLESERKLLSETQRRTRRIMLENEEHDASIFRMGLTVMYYKTAQGNTGIFYRKNRKLFHQQFNDEKVKNRVIQLVEAQNEKLLSELVLTPGMVNGEAL